MTGALGAACGGAGGFASNAGLIVTPATVEGVIAGDGPVTTTSAAAIASFGTGPYTYAWLRTSGDANFTAASPSAATTRFTDSFVEMGGIVMAGFTCTASDSLGAQRTATVKAIGRSSSTF